MTIDTLGSLGGGGRPDRAPGETAPAQPAGRPPATATETATAVTAKTAAPSMDELKSAVDKLNQSLQQTQGLEFTIDEDSKRTIVKVVDRNTHEVVRQIPTEEALQISKSLDKFTGLLIRQEA